LLEYWTKFEEKPPGIHLGQKESVRHLSRVRGGLKHQGMLPSKMDIESCRTCCTSFFEENTPLVFGIQFHDISMANLVHSPEARMCLEEAGRLTGQVKYEDALDQVAMAFARLIDEFESKNRTIRHIPTLSFTDQSALGRRRFKGSDRDELNSLVDEVNDEIIDLREKVAIIGLGLDYSRYLRFRLLTKGITANWNYDHTRLEIQHPRTLIPVNRQTPSADDCHFCIDFVVELALRIQGSEQEVVI